jgi:hypothetical protein
MVAVNVTLVPAVILMKVAASAVVVEVVTTGPEP